MLGGGYFTAQNKTIPGSYINFVSVTSADTGLSDRGIVAMAAELNWGASGIIKVTGSVLANKALETFGYEGDAAELKDIREIMRNAATILLYRLNGGGTKASNSFGTAKYAGTRGNALKTVISANADDGTKWDVCTYLDTTLVDKQVAVSGASALVDNAYFDFDKAATLSATSGTSCSGGTNSTVSGTQHAAFLSALESEHYNILCTKSADAATVALYVAFTKRMIEDVGVKVQCVLANKAADHEGIINVTTSADLVPWVAGAEAGCPINSTITNKIYDGEYDIAASYTQAQLEAAIAAGQLIFHKVGDSHRVLRDINSLVTTSATKGEDFKNNQTIRVINQIGNDVAAIFNNNYLGKVQNDNAGRVAFWSALVNYFNELVGVRAIDAFDPRTDILVEAGQAPTAVSVQTQIHIVSCMEILYMVTYIL